MAEAAGLVLGTVALVSLFSSCVELIEYFELSKSYEYDYELACLKLSMLKSRLDACSQAPGRRNNIREDEEPQKQWLRDKTVIYRSLRGIADIWETLNC
jgi:hypothetical protein